MTVSSIPWICLRRTAAFCENLPISANGQVAASWMEHRTKHPPHLSGGRASDHDQYCQGGSAAFVTASIVDGTATESAKQRWRSILVYQECSGKSRPDPASIASIYAVMGVNSTRDRSRRAPELLDGWAGLCYHGRGWRENPAGAGPGGPARPRSSMHGEKGGST